MTEPQNDSPQPDPRRDDAAASSPPPSDIRAAVTAALVTVAFAVATLLVAAASSGGLRTVLVVVAPIIVLIGAVFTAFKTYRVWQAGGRWQVWQGAMWFQFAFFLIMLFTSAPYLLGE